MQTRPRPECLQMLRAYVFILRWSCSRLHLSQHRKDKRNIHVWNQAVHAKLFLLEYFYKVGRDYIIANLECIKIICDDKCFVREIEFDKLLTIHQKFFLARYVIKNTVKLKKKNFCVSCCRLTSHRRYNVILIYNKA
jgi:hypothetical protein